jgi:NAD(P) transhydrogenase subunit alpha
MVKMMMPCSCIIDISIDQGGNCAITSPGEKVVKHNVIIDGCKNIPGMIPTSSTWMFAHNIYNLLKYLVKNDELHLDMSDEIVESILVCKDKELVHQGTIEAMSLSA